MKRKDYSSYTKESVDGINKIKKTNSITLQLAAEDKKAFKRFQKRFPSSFNPSWIQARICETLYDRNIYDEKEFDFRSELR